MVPPPRPQRHRSLFCAFGGYAAECGTPRRSAQRHADAPRRSQHGRMDLVTGGSGFIGRHVVAELVRRHRPVRVFDRRPLDGDRSDALALTSVEMIVGDILDDVALRRAMRGCRRVFHLAADPSLWHRDPQHFDQVNHEGTRTILRLCAEARIDRVVHTSTEAILTPRHASGPITEEVEVALEDMLGPYCRSKFLAEQAAFEFAARGLPVVIASPTTPVGPGDTTVTPPTRMILDFLAGRIPAYLNGIIDVVDVRDAARGLVLAAERGIPGRRHLLAGRSVEIGTLLRRLAKLARRPPPHFRIPYAGALAFAHAEELVARLTGRPPRAPVSGVRLARRRMVLDASWTRFWLGLRPRPLDESLRDAIRWLRDEGYAPK
jgi:dihydroflavonol-4-reductase